MTREDVEGPVIAEYPAIGYSVAVSDLTAPTVPAYVDDDGNLWGRFRVTVERDGTVEAGYFTSVDRNAFDLAERLASGATVVGPHGSALPASHR